MHQHTFHLDPQRVTILLSALQSLERECEEQLPFVSEITPNKRDMDVLLKTVTQLEDCKELQHEIVTTLQNGRASVHRSHFQVYYQNRSGREIPHPIRVTAKDKAACISIVKAKFPDLIISRIIELYSL